MWDFHIYSRNIKMNKQQMSINYDLVVDNLFNFEVFLNNPELEGIDLLKAEDENGNDLEIKKKTKLGFPSVIVPKVYKDKDTVFYITYETKKDE